MEDKISELQEYINKVISTTKEIVGGVNSEIYSKAPVMIHQAFCHKLVQVCKEHSSKAAKDIPEAIDVLTAIRVLEDIYPELKTK